MRCATQLYATLKQFHVPFRYVGGGVYRWINARLWFWFGPFLACGRLRRDRKRAASVTQFLFGLPFYVIMQRKQQQQQQKSASQQKQQCRFFLVFSRVCSGRKGRGEAPLEFHTDLFGAFTRLMTSTQVGLYL